MELGFSDGLYRRSKGGITPSGWTCEHLSYRYAWNWIQIDTNAHLEMPGSRTMTSPLDHKKWYYANDAGPAVPEGLNDEEAIFPIWTATSSSRKP